MQQPHEQSLDALLQGWLALTDQRQERLFLTDHLDLLAEAVEEALAALLVQAADQPRTQNGLCLRRAILADARQRGGTPEAIRDAYVHVYGGFALEMPEWLKALPAQDVALRQQGRSDQLTAARVALWERAREWAERESLAPAILAEIDMQLSEALRDRRGTDRPQHLEAGIAALQRSATVCTRERSPVQWARIQHDLGEAYRERIQGERADNLEQAIILSEAALQVRTHEAYPYDWSKTQNSLGAAYFYRIRGERADNLERAIALYEAALQIFTRDEYPYEWAQLQQNLGNAYENRIRGAQAENLERAIALYKAALQVYTRAAFPYDWGITQNHLGIAYWDRVRGERAENLERTIAAYEAALQVFIRADFPLEWARLQNNLGNAYMIRVRGERAENLERTIAAHEAALQVRTRASFPFNWAVTQNNLGAAYFYRIRGERAENLERAIAAFESALQVHTRASFPYNWATAQNNLGELYRQRLRGERAENLERAIAAFEAALEVSTRDAFPTRWAETLYNLGEAYTVRIRGEHAENLERAMALLEAALQVRTREAFPAECRSTTLLLAEQLAHLGRWEAAAEAFAMAVAVESDLFVLSAGAEGRDAILREGGAAADAQAFALTRLGRLTEAALAVEAGRARSLAEARRFDHADPRRIGDAHRRQRYEAALTELRAAQAALQQPGGAEQREAYLAAVAAYRVVRGRFDDLIAEIQAARDPADFIQQAITSADLFRAAGHHATGHAIVSLLVTPWGGVALGVLTSNLALFTSDRITALDLPDLTTTLVNDLLEQCPPGDPQRFFGGFGLAQEGSQLERLCAWSGVTLTDRLATLEAAAQAAGTTSALAQAGRAALAIPALHPLAELPVEQFADRDQRRLAGQIDHFFLQLELRRSLEVLSHAVMRPLAAWLREEGVTSVTLIPSGTLTTFPLLAAPIGDDQTPWQTLATTMPASSAPSALSLLPGERAGHRRAGVSAVGNPLPTHQHLEWGEAEALTLAYLGGDHQRRSVRTGYDATRAWFITAAGQARVLEASCHGLASGNDFLQYQILLANDEAFTLADALNNVVDLRGLRLLILSACQTSLVNRRGAPGEMRSLAVGMLQAGADAVLAALWPVDDRATYLLMVRFAQEWFPTMEWEPPAAALARAQSWMREVTWSEVHEWVARELLPAITLDPTLAQQVAQVAGDRAIVTKRATLFSERYAFDLIVPRGERLGIGRAEALIREWAGHQQTDARPFTDPYYWAAFHIVGW